MKIDLHVHASERSGCSVSTQEEQLAAAKAVGLDGIAFSDHDRLVPPGEMQALRQRHAPLRIFTSIEVSIREGEHILVVGIHDPKLEQYGWTYRELHSFVRAEKGWLAIAHPGRFQPCSLDVERFPPDAVEMASSNITPEMQPAIQAVAARAKCPLIVTSDSHNAKVTGTNFIEVEGDIQTDSQLVDALRNQRYTCSWHSRYEKI
jgi:predicted metal-dependent phosphoesterase TrpH